ncbi:14675_t:CDS:2 [Acaulospora colombiana]|uniref:14675_t:CDS:1 n=1 Tax=Acaulospora colombiana TaxID=27376 RepID=A0ACA9KCB8_9GLOM|nr:14675_t:CDS:2 [Acaulospora colombiana]
MESTTFQRSPGNSAIESIQSEHVQSLDSTFNMNGSRGISREEKERIKQIQRDREKKKSSQKVQVQEVKADPFLRQMIPLSVESGDRESITIMTYNILAQSLCKRELYPDSGESLKWKYRRPQLIKEILHYEPDIACFQEMDDVSFNNTFKSEFEHAGYEIFYFKSDKKTNARQGLLFCESLIKFNKEFGFAVFLTGDFNSSPDSPTYRLMAQKEPLFTEKEISELRDSMRPINDEKDLIEDVSSPNSADKDACGGKCTALPEDGDPFGASTLTSTAAQSSNIPTSSIEDLPRCRPTLPDLFSRFSNLPLCTSLYSKYYPLKDPDNTFQMEPKFTIYGKYFEGTVDYIFYIHDEGGEIENEENREQANKEYFNGSLVDRDDSSNILGKIGNREIRVSKILRMPTKEEVETHPPNHKFGSDHMCLMVEIEGLC